MNPQLEAFLTLLRRYPFAATCIFLILGSGAGAYILSGAIDSHEAARIDRAKEGEAMLELLVSGSTQRQELDAVREITRRIENNLVVDDLADNQGYFFKIEGQTKARLSELRPQSSPTTDGTNLYRRVPYSLRVNGSYEQVSAYLLALETGPRLANISAFGFSRRDKDSNAVVLDLTLEFLGKK